MGILRDGDDYDPFELPPLLSAAQLSEQHSKPEEHDDNYETVAEMEQRHLRKWQLLVHLYDVANSGPYRYLSVERALRAVTGHSSNVTQAQFVSGIMGEYQVRLEKHKHCLLMLFCPLLGRVLLQLRAMMLCIRAPA
jgi:hypothetical protein